MLPLGLAWMTFAWVMSAWPITGVVAIAAMLLDRRGEAPPPSSWARRLRLLSPLGITATTLLWASAYYTPAHVPPVEVPWFAYVIAGLYALQLALGAGLLWQPNGRRDHVVAVVLPQLWVGLVASFVSWWAVMSGGTLGAL